MLLQEREFWGPPAYTTTLVDEKGAPIGIAWANGDITMVPTKSRVGEVVKDYDGTVATIVWDGAYVVPGSGLTKGRLLAVDGPPYLDSLVVFCNMLKVRGDGKAAGL